MNKKGGCCNTIITTRVMDMLIELLYLFFVYAVLGWIVEVVFHVVTIGSFTNRGFLKGPYCPIYGFGKIFILYLLNPYIGNLPILFILSMAITTLIELIAGYILEHFLHKRWWDYSDLPFNYRGYICLKFSIYWGMGALFVVKFVHPIINHIYRHLPHFIILALIIIMFSMMVIDFITTLANILGLNKQISQIEEIENRITKLSNDMGEIITEGVLISQEGSKKIEEALNENLKAYETLIEKASKKHKRIIMAFPNIRDTRNNELLEKIKHKVDEGNKNKKIRQTKKNKKRKTNK